MHSTLDRYQRLALLNQFNILAQVDEHEREQWKRKSRIVSRGFEGEYDSLFSQIETDTLSSDECAFVMDTLDMFRVIHVYQEQSDNPSAFDGRHIKFEGFDSNNEHKYYSYLHFLRTQDMWEELMPHGAIDSHHPTLERYRRMVAQWHASDDKYDLKESDVARIATAGGFFRHDTDDEKVME